MRTSQPDWAPDRVYSRINTIDVANCKRRSFEVTSSSLTFACKFTARQSSDAATDILYVTLRSSVDRAVHSLPVFTRQGRHEAMQGHHLSICDPTLSLSPDLRIGCFLGQAERDPIPKVVEIARAVARSLGLAGNRIVYWASSAGAFGAAMAAIHAGSGRAVLVNPLLEIGSFIRSKFAPGLLDVFGGESFDHVLQAYPLRMSVSAALKAARGEGHAPRLLIVQNRADLKFYRGQYVPFCEAFGVPVEGGFDATKSLKSLLYKDQTGHGNETEELTQIIVANGFPMPRGASRPEITGTATHVTG